MTQSVPAIISLVLAVLAVGGCFIPRFPAVILGWLSLLGMHIAGAPYASSQVLIFWGIAAIIVLMLGILQPKALTAARAGHGYVCGATLVGVVLGYLVQPMAAAIIIGGALGAFLGCMAFMRTPSAPRFALSSPEFIQYLCAKGLPAVVTCSMAAIVAAMSL